MQLANMKIRGIQPSQVYFTVIATLYIAVLLAWQHFNGGVISHHILHRGDLPAVSNWWGILLLPTLTWFLVGRITKREEGLTSKAVIIRLTGSLLYGTLLSVAFLNGLEALTSLMGPGLLVLALFIPIYRAEHLLGFILSMTFTFGAILPTVFAAVVALLAYVIYRFIRPIPVYLFSLVSKSKGAK